MKGYDRALYQPILHTEACQSAADASTDLVQKNNHLCRYREVRQIRFRLHGVSVKGMPQLVPCILPGHESWVNTNVRHH